MAISACRLMDTIEASHSVTFVLPVRALNGVCEKKKIQKTVVDSPTSIVLVKSDCTRLQKSVHWRIMHGHDKVTSV